MSSRYSPAVRAHRKHGFRAFPRAERAVTMRIEVTQEDIKKGERHSGISCPIALALKRALPGRHVGVSEETADIGENARVLLPLEAQDFIDDFDDGLGVDPFAFELDYSGES